MAIVHQHLVNANISANIPANIAAGVAADDADAMTLAHLQRIIEQRSLTARFSLSLKCRMAIFWVTKA